MMDYTTDKDLLRQILNELRALKEVLTPVPQEKQPAMVRYAAQFKALKLSGMTYERIAKRYGISRQRVYQIIKQHSSHPNTKGE